MGLAFSFLSWHAISTDIGSLLVLYVAFMPLLWMPLFNASIFFPDKQKYEAAAEIAKIEEKFQAQYENVYFPGQGGQTLNGWLFTLPGAKKTVLVSHGNAGNIAYRLPLASLLLACGVSVFLYDYQGYGESSGRPTLGRVCADAVSAFDYLVGARKVLPSEIIVYGESLGAGVSCELANKRPVAGLVLQSGFFSLVSCGRDFYPWLRLYPEWFFPEPRMDNGKFVSQSHPPVLFIHGKKDQVLSCRYSERLMEKAVPPKQLLLLANAEHNDVTSNGEVISGLRAFLAGIP